jgi:hypothetical protein
MGHAVQQACGGGRDAPAMAVGDHGMDRHVEGCNADGG